jgi:hypothetical protein
MAKVKAKGSLLKTTISASLTTIAQCTEISIGEQKNRMLDVECLDDGAVTQEPITATILYDPDGATHQFITDTIALGAASFPIASSVVFADATPASATFSAAGYGFSASMSVKGLLTAQISMTPAGVVAYPT